MWSRIASIVDDLNFDDDDGSDDSSFSNEEKEQSRIDIAPVDISSVDCKT